MKFIQILWFHSIFSGNFGIFQKSKGILRYKYKRNVGHRQPSSPKTVLSLTLQQNNNTKHRCKTLIVPELKKAYLFWIHICNVCQTRANIKSKIGIAIVVFTITTKQHTFKMFKIDSTIKNQIEQKKKIKNMNRLRFWLDYWLATGISYFKYWAQIPDTRYP